MARFALFEFSRPLTCALCNRDAVGSGAVLYLTRSDGYLLDLDQERSLDAHKATYRVVATLCGDPVTFRPDDRSIIFHIANNSPLPGTYATATLATGPAGGDLLGELFAETQQAAISRDVSTSAAYATVANELMAHFPAVRKQLIDAATGAGLTNLTFDPDAELADAIDHMADDGGRDIPVIRFALKAKSARWTLDINGEVFRTLRDPMRAPFYCYSPLTLMVFGTGFQREGQWQPMATDFLGEGDDDIVARVDTAYSVNAERLKMVITELVRGA